MDQTLQRAQYFDLQALTEIYDLYSPRLYSYAYRMLGDEALAEDCVAETFTRFLNAMKAGKGPQDYLQAYLYRVAHNWISDYYRRSPPPPLELFEEMPAGGEEHTEQVAMLQILQAEVRAAIYRLTPEQRQVVMLRFVEGWENDEISAAVQKPVGAIKALQHRGITALRKMLLGAEEMEYGTY